MSGTQVILYPGERRQRLALEAAERFDTLDLPLLKDPSEDSSLEQRILGVEDGKPWKGQARHTMLITLDRLGTLREVHTVRWSGGRRGMGFTAYGEFRVVPEGSAGLEVLVGERRSSASWTPTVRKGALVEEVLERVVAAPRSLATPAGRRDEPQIAEGVPSVRTLYGPFQIAHSFRTEAHGEDVVGIGTFHVLDRNGTSIRAFGESVQVDVGAHTDRFIERFGASRAAAEELVQSMNHAYEAFVAVAQDLREPIAANAAEMDSWNAHLRMRTLQLQTIGLAGSTGVLGYGVFQDLPAVFGLGTGLAVVQVLALVVASFLGRR